MYNLLDEGWLPVLWADGKCNRIGIRTALAEAHRIRQIAASNPMDRVAVIRFLLALLYWCHGNPPGQPETFPMAFPAEWFSILDENENRKCFELLGEEKRFYQDVNARRERPVTDLIQEVPTGNNFWHLRHSSDGKEGFCLPCCVFGLLRLPLFSVSGLPNLRSGINGAPPIYAIPVGESLLDTLLINWLPFDDIGLPSWRKEDIRVKPGEAVPFLPGLTMLSRRVWLHDPNKPSGACVACGSREEALIRTCEFQTAGEQENPGWSDPHVVYYYDRKIRKSLRSADLRSSGQFYVDRPIHNILRRIIEDRMFGIEAKSRYLFIVGFSSHQAYNIDVWEKTIKLPHIDNFEDVLSKIDSWNFGTNNLKRKVIYQKNKNRLRQSTDIVYALSNIRPHVESRVSDRLSQLMNEGQAAWQEAANGYKPMMNIIAKSTSPGFTTAALEKRRLIAGTLPDMNQPGKSIKSSAKKQGGKK